MKKDNNCYKTLTLVMIVLVALLAYVVVTSYKVTPEIKDITPSVLPPINPEVLEAAAAEGEEMAEEEAMEEGEEMAEEEAMEAEEAAE